MGLSTGPSAGSKPSAAAQQSPPLNAGHQPAVQQAAISPPAAAASSASRRRQVKGDRAEQRGEAEPLRLIAPPRKQQPKGQAVPEAASGRSTDQMPSGPSEPPTIQRTSLVQPLDRSNHYGHAPDYSWVKGRLEYSALHGGGWLLRYAPFDEDDRYGGSVLLDIDPGSRGYKPGDWVKVKGQLVQPAADSSRARPAYRVAEMSKVK